MRKRISIKTRRPGLSPEAFRDHYESRHVPLGLGHVDHFQWRRYVRNYVVATTGTPVPFDGYAEFWVDDDADDEALARFVASPAFAALDEDDRRFLDVDARFSGEVVAVPFDEAGSGSRGAATQSVNAAQKIALLWTSGAEPTSACAERLTTSLADRLADRFVDATLERVLDPPPTAPFDTLLTMWLVDARVADVPVESMPERPWSWLTLDPVETPADLLFGGARTAGAESLASAPESPHEIERNPR